MKRPLVIAILAKDKAHVLPLYLQALERQNWPKDRTILYIRTNNNKDATLQVLTTWLARVSSQYLEVLIDTRDVPEPVQEFGHHEWSPVRLKVLQKIRNDSLAYAREKGAHYGVVDCDNLISSDTLSRLMESVCFFGRQYFRGVIVAPLLHSLHGNGVYSNYHAAIDSNGYYAGAPHYELLRNQTCKGFCEVPVVHCTYVVHYKCFRHVTYDDESGRYDYVNFSDSARRAGIPQILDTRGVYGHITFSETEEQLLKEPWLGLYQKEMKNDLA